MTVTDWPTRFRREMNEAAINWRTEQARGLTKTVNRSAAISHFMYFQAPCGRARLALRWASLERCKDAV
jgi:hypothetical protein